MRPFLTVLAALMFVASFARAQIPEDSSHLHRGIVGIEAGFGQAPGASGFFFSSRTTSWLLGIDRVTTEHTIGTQVTRTTSAGFRVGVRRWAGDMTGPFKLFVGAGAGTADENRDQSSRLGDGVGYGELGTAFFLSPHLSLVGAGELSFAYGKDRSNGGDIGVENDHLFIRAARFRVGAAVYLF